MNELSNPSADLKIRILGEVSFEERLTGFIFRPRTGPRRIFLYSCREVLGLLCDEHPRMDFNRLAQWIGETIGDRELAGLIGTVDRQAGDNHEKTLVIRDYLAERIWQCQK